MTDFLNATMGLPVSVPVGIFFIYKIDPFMMWSRTNDQ